MIETRDERLFKSKGEFVARRIGDETILVPIRNHVGDLDSVFTMNEVAAAVWALLDGAHSVDSLAETISAQFEVDVPTARADVQELLTELVQAGLVQSAAGD